MRKEVENFLTHRKIKIKNSAKYAFFVLSVLAGVVFPWVNSSLLEKIIFSVILWIDLFVVLFYATNERMKQYRKKIAFYGWSIYFLSWLLIYASFRIVFRQYHWLLLVYIGYGIIQTIIWDLGVIRNINRDRYCTTTPIKPTINIFSIASCLMGIAMIIFASVVMIMLDYEAIVCVIVGCFLLIHYFLLLSVTVIHQWVLMVKYGLTDIA